ncbi:MAG: LysR family transcriptional regulator [Rhodobacteraceae bacterium]|nr:LysR family transcriptional regulator [Paracoccaceae bacterium]
MNVIEKPITGENRFLTRVLFDHEDVKSGNYWAELRVFLAVAKSKSFNRAADMLKTSAATVSRRVHRLQDLLKTELLISGPTGVQLTPEGVDLAVLLTRLDGMLNDITKNLGDPDQDAYGEVGLAMTEGLATCYLSGFLRQLGDAHPGISITVKTPRNANDLRMNSADMMLGFAPDEGSDVVCRQLGTVHFVPVASADYLLRYGYPTAHNLKDHLIIQSPLYSPNNAFWNSWTETVRPCRARCSAESSTALFGMIRSGLGIGLLANVVTVDPNLVHLDLGVHIEMPIYGVAFTETVGEGPNKIVFKQLCEHYSEKNPWLQRRLTFGHQPSVFDESFRATFNLCPTEVSLV